MCGHWTLPPPLGLSMPSGLLKTRQVLAVPSLAARLPTHYVLCETYRWQTQRSWKGGQRAAYFSAYLAYPEIKTPIVMLGFIFITCPPHLISYQWDTLVSHQFTSISHHPNHASGLDRL